MEQQLKSIKGNTKTLLNFYGFKSIQQARKNMTGTDKQIYQRLFEEYRDDVNEHNKLVKSQLAKKKRQEAKKQKELKSITANVIEIKDGDITIINQLYNLVKQDKPFKVTLIGDIERTDFQGDEDEAYIKKVLKNNTNILKEKDYDFRGKKLNDAFTELHHDFLVESPEVYIWDKLVTRIFITFGEKPVKANQIIQAFFEGTVNCVMMPIIRFLEEKINTSNNDKTKANHKSRLNKAIQLETKYHDLGVNEQALNEISNELQLDIYVDLPFQKNFIVSKSNKKAFRTFHFVNTRLNHVDFSEITHTDNMIELSLDELKSKQIELDKDKQFYTYTKNYSSINSITTLDSHFTLKNDFKDAVYEFECESGLLDVKLDDVTQNEVSQFVRQGCHFNETVDVNHFSKSEQKEGLETLVSNYFHIDMEKAYINYETCKYYDGFVGKITDFRKCDKIMGVGYYQIKNLVLHGKIKEMNVYLNCYYDNVYPSPELQMLKDYGCSFDIVCGCWGSEIEFEFNDRMINGKEVIGKTDEGKDIVNRYYCKYIGQMFCENRGKSYYIKADGDFKQHLVNEVDANIMVYDNEVKVSYPRNHKYHLSHVCGFILSYMRMNMIEQLEQFKKEEIIKIVVDGIYHTKKEVKLCNVFRDEPKEITQNIAGLHYFSNMFDEYKLGIEYECGEFRDHNMAELHLGAGGCGKTHKQLTDKGFVGICYYAPSWKLARNKQKEYGCNVNTIAKLISTDPKIIGEQKKYYNVFIIDEVSMMSNEDKEYILETYHDCKLIFCGDIGYQLPAIEGSPFKNDFKNVIHHNINYRVKCQKLEILLKEVRKMIEYGVSPRQEIINSCKHGTDDGYDYKNDLIICSTHSAKDVYTEKYNNLEKYYVLQSDRVYGRGEIYFEKPNAKCEIRHAYTIHSIQGETAKGKLFIDIKKIYNPQMLYTAISRSQYLDQIVLI